MADSYPSEDIAKDQCKVEITKMSTGITINVIIVVGIAVFVLLAILQLIFEKTDKSIGRAIIDIGAALTLSAAPSALEIYAGLFSSILGIDLPILNNSETFTIICLILGVLLIFFGCFINSKIQTPVHILNMVGPSKREINNYENEKKLHIAEYKIKEQVVDIMPIFGTGEKIDRRTNGLIVKQIEEDINRFSNRTEGRTSCFTGMAPVPYTILAGTYLTNTNITRFFEYERYNTESYYELSRKHTHKNKKWPSLIEIGNIHETDDEDVVLSISVSQNVLEEDLKIFENKPVVVLSIPNARDNLIQYKDQLIEYRNVIYDYINQVIKQRYKNVKRIHIVAAIPSCLSLEIGRAIGSGKNRIPQVVAYHYISSNDNKYTFGVYISGSLNFPNLTVSYLPYQN